MDETPRTLRVFIGCPGDLAPERAELLRLREHFEEVGRPVHFLIWKNATPGVGNAQEVIFREYPVETWDIFLGLLWTRFGVPSGFRDGPSGELLTGTEAEFTAAYDAHVGSSGQRPEVLLYRCGRKAEIDTSAPDLAERLTQMQGVQRFFQQIETDARRPMLAQEFQTAEDLCNMVRRDLTKIADRLHGAAEAADKQRLQAELAAAQVRLAELEKERATTQEPVREVQARLAAQGPGAGAVAVAAAQAEVAAERGETIEALRGQLAAAEDDAHERVRLSERIEELAHTEITAARKARRAALLDLIDAAMANIKYADAVRHARQATGLFDRATEPLAWADAQAKAGNALYYDGQYAASATVWREVLTERERHLGATDAATLLAVNDLALALQDAGDSAGAEPLYRRGLAAQERVLGAEHPDTLVCVNNLALLLQAKGDYAGAEPLYRRALEARGRLLGPEHPATLISVNNLAELLRARGDFAGAEPLYRRALAAQERVLGPEHPNTLSSVNNLAVLLDTKGDAAGAEPLYRRALEARECVLGPEHPLTCLSAYNLARFLEDRGRAAEIGGLVRQAYRGWLKSKGPEHEDTRYARALLERLGETVED